MRHRTDLFIQLRKWVPCPTEKFMERNYLWNKFFSFSKRISNTISNWNSNTWSCSCRLYLPFFFMKPKLSNKLRVISCSSVILTSSRWEISLTTTFPSSVSRWFLVNHIASSVSSNSLPWKSFSKCQQCNKIEEQKSTFPNWYFWVQGC